MAPARTSLSMALTYSKVSVQGLVENAEIECHLLREGRDGGVI